MPGARSDKRTANRRSREAERTYFKWRLDEIGRERNTWHTRAIDLMARVLELEVALREQKGEAAPCREAMGD